MSAQYACRFSMPFGLRSVDFASVAEESTPCRLAGKLANGEGSALWVLVVLDEFDTVAEGVVDVAADQVGNLGVPTDGVAGFS